MSANILDRKLMLKELHERFWHAPAAEMTRLLQAACVPRGVVIMGAEVPSECDCHRHYQQPMHRALVKAGLASQFNDVVRTTRPLLSMGH